MTLHLFQKLSEAELYDNMFTLIQLGQTWFPGFQFGVRFSSITAVLYILLHQPLPPCIISHVMLSNCPYLSQNILSYVPFAVSASKP
jgi:hypothetical protein